MGAILVFGVGSYCAWLCSEIDVRFSYFGRPGQTVPFIAAGVGPAIIGARLYGWPLFGRENPANLAKEEHSI